MLAVKLYSTMPEDNENVLAGISGKIPAVVVFGVETEPDETYTIMTEEQYHNYLASIEQELDLWKQMQENIGQ